MPPSTDADETVFRESLRVLASDEYGGRRPGTPDEDRTVAYLVEHLRKLGMKPGNGTSYLQSVPMVEMLAGADASLSISGSRGRLALQDLEDMVIRTRGPELRSELTHSELVFVGYGISAAEYGWNDYADLDVRGKTVIILAGDPGSTGKDPKLFKGHAMSRYGLWGYKLEEAIRHGADAALLIHGAGAGLTWNAVVNSWSGPQFSLVAPDNAGRSVIEGWVSGRGAGQIFAAAGLDPAALTAAAGQPGFKPVPMGLYADARLQNSIRRFNSSNVIALLPGAGRSREYIVYTAHWDSLGRAAGRGGEIIFNGAVDNASGVAGLLTLAQSFARTKPPPDRSIVFLALTGAESGLLGSAYYADNPLFPLNKTAAVLNLDSLHIGGPTRDVAVYGYGNSELDEYVREAADLQGREVHPDPNPEQGWYYRSDQFSFAEHGVPALYAKGGIDDSARGPVFGQAMIDDYLQLRYRQPGDRYSADWDVRGTLQDLDLYYAVGMRLARTRRFPKWNPDSEFHAARELDREHRERD